MANRRDELATLKRKMRHLENRMASTKEMLKQVYQYFTGAFEGMSEAVFKGLQAQELLCEKLGVTREDMDKLVAERIAAKQAEREAAMAEAKAKAEALEASVTEPVQEPISADDPPDSTDDRPASAYRSVDDPALYEKIDAEETSPKTNETQPPQ